MVSSNYSDQVAERLVSNDPDTDVELPEEARRIIDEASPQIAPALLAALVLDAAQIRIAEENAEPSERGAASAIDLRDITEALEIARFGAGVQ